MRSLNNIKRNSRYNKDGVLLSRGDFVNGVMVGKWVFYHLNGKIRSKGVYVNNEREGVWETYWSNGELKDIELYECGRYIRDIEL